MTTAALIRTAAGCFTAPPTTRDELFTLWAVATAESNATFVAADDRAGAAQDAFAAFAG